MGAAEWLAAGLLASALAAPVSQAWEQQRRGGNAGSGASAGYVWRAVCGAAAQGAGAAVTARACLIERSSGLRLGEAMPLLPSADRSTADPASATDAAGGTAQEAS